MYHLKSIGTMERMGNQAEIKIMERYRKALQYVDEFSHVHVFVLQEEEGKWHLCIVIGKIVNLSKSSGIVSILMDENEKLKGEDYLVIDIKPYFPCEDSVKGARSLHSMCSRSIIVQSADKSEMDENKPHLKLEEGEELFRINPVGVIRNTQGKLYIQCDEIPKIEGDYIKVLWWFDKFDAPIYRKVTECDPPYENAPRSGIFATRSPVRPNPIAMTVARITRIDSFEKRIYVNALECFDKTPCVGILTYDGGRDKREKVKVPKWLEHWPEWMEEDEMLTSEEVSLKDGLLSRLIQEKKDKQDEKTGLSKQHRKEEKWDRISVYGARENNLKGIHIEIPYGKITAVVGVSGSGKSSLVMDTVYAECKRRMDYLSNERNVLQKPDAEYISGCIPAVMISQNEIRGNSQSTVGTYTNAYDYLRMIYATAGIRHCPKCGNEIIPLSRDRILSLLEKSENVRIYDRNRNPISTPIERNELEKGTEGKLSHMVDLALLKGKGAFYATVNDSDFILLQTKQKCYHCDQIMFEMTPSVFSYLDPEYRCPVCHGTGKVTDINESRIIEHPEKSVLDGASSFWGNLRTFRENPNANWMKGQVFGLAEKMGVDLEQPWEKLPFAYRDVILHGASTEIVTFRYDNKKIGRKGEIARPVEGVCQIIKRLYDENHNTSSLQKYISEIPCHYCKGERLGKEGRMVTIGGIRYPESADLNFEQLTAFCEQLPSMMNEELYSQIKNTVQRLYELAYAAKRLGISYLKMTRGTATLSGGERQRLKLLAAMQNHMSGILYIFDEPSRGLHPKDYDKIAYMLHMLKSEGNTIIMVEHNEDMIRLADNVLEIGPGAGVKGGSLVGEGTLSAMLEHKGTQLYAYMNLKNKRPRKEKERELGKFLTLEGLNYNNLKNVSVRFPQNAMTCICGVSGSGKSSLMKGEIYPRFKEKGIFSQAILVDQLPIGKNSRSVVATYIGIMDEIRSVMAATHEAVDAGFDESFFSFNGTNGQCQTCKGDGRLQIKYMEDSYITCPDCKGHRYKKEVLKIQYEGKNISELLEMSVAEAGVFWKDNRTIADKLAIIEEVGMEYLKVGQSTTTLSGGEASRLKLAKELMSAKTGHTLYLLDEPTTGLHFSDIENILHLMHKLVDEGNTVVTIEHNKQFMKQCDWYIELGPKAGDLGGEVIYQGKNLSI